ncbi:MAG: serine hydrolase domain-containing protein [Novosphingobium sp.]
MNYRIAVVGCLTALGIAAECPLAQARPADAGMSAARLERVTEAEDKAIANGSLSGVVTIVYRKDRLAYVSARGYQDVSTKTPMRRDTIFALASMTKPITAVATMMLVEEGKLRLDEPVDRLLPELANRKVLDDPSGPLDHVHPSPRPITVRDLLTYRIGIGVIGYAGVAEDSPIGKAYAATTSPGLTADEYMARLGALPLVYAPGERFMYNAPSLVLGVLVARASGMPFDRFLETRIFRPLAMKDTAFFVPAEKRNRLATVYATGAQGTLVPTNRQTPNAAPVFPNAAGGLYSTADDYMAFARLMLGKGRLRHVRLLSERSVDMMTRDYLTAEAPNSFFIHENFFENAGFGYGLQVQTKPVSPGPSPGSYWWQGATGVAWTADPKEQMIFVRMIQNMKPPAQFNSEFMTALYEAIER